MATGNFASGNRIGSVVRPWHRIEYTLMVPAGSPIHSVADADRRGIRIAVVRNHASTLALGRILRHAEQVVVDTPHEAFALLSDARVDTWASVRSLLLHYCRRLAEARVLDQSYGANQPAWVVAKGQEARLAYVSEFIAHAKASGLVQQAIERSGRKGITIPV